MTTLNLELVIGIDTGGKKENAHLFSLDIPEIYIPVLELASLWSVFINVKVRTANEIKPFLLDALMYMCEYPNTYMDQVIVPNEVLYEFTQTSSTMMDNTRRIQDFKQQVYFEVLRDLARFIKACDNYPKAIVHRRKE